MQPVEDLDTTREHNNQAILNYHHHPNQTSDESDQLPIVVGSIVNENQHANNIITNSSITGAETQKHIIPPKPDEVMKKDSDKMTTVISISDIIDEFGFYQLSLTLITFIRYISLAMMTNTGPLIAPEVDFYCKLPASINSTSISNKPNNISVELFLKDKCHINLVNGRTFECNEWYYDKSRYGTTLTDTFDLVCDREWLRSALQSTISFGIVMAAVIWGSVSDKNGRKFTVQFTFVLSLISGIVSYFANSLALYAISRAICSFSDLGLVVSLSTTIVETLGKFRGAVCIIVYTGWAFGVLVMPWLTEYFRDFRQLMLFTIAIHLITLPWLLTIKESARWLLVNGRIEEAREELRRICRWNSAFSDVINCSVSDSTSQKLRLQIVDEKFDLLKVKFVKLEEEKSRKKRKEDELNTTTTMKNKHDSIVGTDYLLKSIGDLVRLLFGGLAKVGKLFQTKELGRTTATIIWTTFNCELLYMLFIIINSDIGDNVKMNYAIGGIMETLATLLALVIIEKFTRKVSIVVNIILISLLCLIFAFTHSHPVACIYLLNSTKLAISILSSVLYVVTTEIFPTNLRQTGFGLTGTVGSLGAVVAPFFRTELTELIGLKQVLIIVALVPLTAASIIPFFLRETKGVELPDNVDDIRNNTETSEQQQQQQHQKHETK